MAVCDDHHDDTEYVKNPPKLIVEVLSKSTSFYDHSVKQETYIAINSLEYYVLVEQEYCEICVLSRATGFVPSYYTLGDEIEFPLIDACVSVNDIYDRINKDDKQKELYNKREKANKDITNAVDKALKNGLEQGANNEKRAVAKKLLMAKVDVELIASTTGLSISYIENL